MCSNCAGDYEDPEVTREPVEEDESEEESFADAQGRLGRALDFLASQVAPHLEK